MSNSTPRSSAGRLYRLLATVLLAATVVACRCSGPEEVARLSKCRGRVEVQRGSRPDWRPAGNDTRLALADHVRTGQDGSTRVVLADGSSLVLGPGSQLGFARRGGRLVTILERGQVDAAAGKSAALVESAGSRRVELRAGAARFTKRGGRLLAESQGKSVLALAGGSRLKMGQGARVDLGEADEEFVLLLEEGDIEVEAGKSKQARFTMRFGETSMEVTPESRGRISRGADGVKIQMLLGNAVIDESGSSRRLSAGTSYDVDLGQLEIKRRQEVETFLLDRRRATRLRLPGSRRFSRPRLRRLLLKPGTALRLPVRATVAMVDSDSNRLELRSGGQGIFEGVYTDGQRREGIFTLEEGSLRFRLRRQGAGQAIQRISTPLGKVVARTTGLTTEADLKVDMRKGARLVVHSGRAVATVGDRQVTVTADQVLEVGADGRTTGPRNLPSPPVRVHEGKLVQIFYDTGVPGLSFVASGPAAGAVLELSRSSSFADLLLQEPLPRSPFGYRLLRGGNYSWRLRRDGPGAGKVGRIILKRDPLLAGGRGSSVVNEVPDTGVETRIFFQGRAPALRFKWNPQPGAASYRLLLYNEDHLEKPLLERQTDRPRLQLPSGTLKEGSYYWYQAALAGDGKVLARSQMNKLTLLFDNAALLLRIDSPAPRQRPRGTVVVIRGVASVGARLSANGRKVQLDDSGRFNQVLEGVRPGGMVVFRLRRADLPDTYFVRHLGG